MQISETVSESIQNANSILSRYGKVLSKFDQTSYGIALSKLPNSKIEIKNAIQLLLLELGKDESKLQEGLIQGYVILAQFIPDEKITILLEANNIFNNDSIDKTAYKIAEQASHIINTIKLEMEDLMEEIQLYISKNHSSNNLSIK